MQNRDYSILELTLAAYKLNQRSNTESSFVSDILMKVLNNLKTANKTMEPKQEFLVNQEKDKNNLKA